jgi:phage tail-like protein
MTSPSAKRHDPLTVFCFRVQITIDGNELGDAFFKSVTGLKYESEVVDYHEGGFNVTTRRLVGPTKWPNLVLKRGFAGPPLVELLNWRRSWLDDDPKSVLVRANGKIVQLSSDLKQVCAWKFYDGWPCKWEGPEYDASKDELAIETLEIAHEGLVFDPTDKRGGA